MAGFCVQTCVFEKIVFTSREKAFCWLEYAKTNSNKNMQRAFARKFSKKSPTAKQTRSFRITTALETAAQDIAAACMGGAGLPT